MNLRQLRHGTVAVLAALALSPAAVAVADGIPTTPPASSTAPSQQAPTGHAPTARHTTPSNKEPNAVRRSSRGVVATRTARLNIRSGPGTGYHVIGSLRHGAKVPLAYKKDGTRVGGNKHWYKLADRKGYVSARYVRNLDVVPEK
ncbi:SH3 domain-containing protein [Streptomyces sp. KM273126]|uniref:SH3 domain-containing protein n=1 Tax=Streptomyces sp. KM273126 TaxID=2545247 RepID=UPI00103C9EBB|nr:SH3 domain-containing protein [Streptomyces sp. KM273126]MBA2812549.1 SH3 domain-containing protein [Streptomyces sp. KM273126]